MSQQLGLRWLLLFFLCFSGLHAETKQWTLTNRQMCDLEMLAEGGFFPLTGFMSQEDYDSCVHKMRLKNGSIWPMPITLDVTEKFAESLVLGEELVLVDDDHTPIATMKIEEIYTPDKSVEAEKVFGTTDRTHPAVRYLYEEAGNVYVAGRPQVLKKISHSDFAKYRYTPEQMKKKLKKARHQRVVAFQTRNPLHRAHVEITKRAARSKQAHLLLQPIVGMTKPGDVDPYTRVRCYEHVVKHYPEGSVTLSVLPLAMRMAGPREALWHALIRKNYGATHFIVGRDHAGPGNDSHGNPFYGPYDAQDLVARFSDEIGIEMVPFQNMVYVADEQRYAPENEIRRGQKTLAISGTEIRRRLRTGEEIPSWFSYPEVVAELRRAFPSPKEQGLTVFFTGLSGAGKSTLAKALSARLRESQYRPVSVFDGDVIRRHLSKGLGFSKEDRSTNVRRVGFVASQVTKNHGIAVCSMIAPYKEDRNVVRKQVEESGNYVEIYVSTPLEICEKRDVKGLYAKARQGVIRQFTGIDDPYEAPEEASLVIDTASVNVDDAVDLILEHLIQQGYIEPIAGEETHAA